jgi:hypothetical protein
MKTPYSFFIRLKPSQFSGSSVDVPLTFFEGGDFSWECGGLHSGRPQFPSRKTAAAFTMRFEGPAPEEAES